MLFLANDKIVPFNFTFKGHHIYAYLHQYIFSPDWVALIYPPFFLYWAVVPRLKVHNLILPRKYV